MFPFPVGYISFQAADGYRRSLLVQCTDLLTLCLLRADPPADARQGVFALEYTHCLRHVVIPYCFNEVGDVYIHRAAADTGLLRTLNTAVSFFKCHLMGVAQSYLVEVSCPDLGVLAGHG